MKMSEKIMRATLMAQMCKNVAASIRYDAEDFDCRWPIRHADHLENIANEFLKIV